MDFSIAIPTYNEDKYLPCLLDSIQKQTLRPFEIIVGDRAGRDNTREIAKNYGCIVVEGGNCALSRNSAGRAVRTELIVFMDADIVLDKNDFFEKAISRFEKEELDLASCFSKNLPSNKFLGRLVLFGANLRTLFNTVTLTLLNRITGAGASFLIVKKEVFEKLNGFNEKFVNYEDTDFVTRAIKAGYKYRILPLAVQVSGRRYQDKGFGNLLKVAYSLFSYKISRVFKKRKAEAKLTEYTKSKGEMGGG